MPTTADTEARLATLTADLKRWVDQYDSLTSKRNTITAQMYAAAYEWVQLCIAERGAKDVKAGCIRLGQTLKRSYKNIESWYYCGAYMAQHSLDVKRVDPRSVRAVYMRRKALTKAEQIQVLQMIRDGAPAAQVEHVVKMSLAANGVAAEKKATSLEKNGGLTKVRLKMEMMALQTLARMYFNSPLVEVVIMTHEHADNIPPSKVLLSTIGKV